MGIEPTYNSSAEPLNFEVKTDKVDWVAFKQYVEGEKYRGCYGSNLFNYAVQYGDYLVKKDLSSLRQLPRVKVPIILKALSLLSKFLGCSEEFQQLVKNYGLSWVSRSADDLIIDRLNARREPDDVFKWIRDVKEACPDYSVFMDFIAVTGLRLSEAIHSYNLIVQLSKENFLAEKYYNVNTAFLEHYRFKETFIRSCKKAFLSYVPLELLDLIGKQRIINENHLKNKALERKHIPQRFSDVRENHASFTTKWLRPEEIDLLHGRVTGSVFMVHYYNPNLVTDLRSRVSQAAQAILLKVNSELILKKNVDGEVKD
ncbi:MAG: hypothetical protein ABSF65_05380 [Candidatus Bathyarchaeia archaeon]